mgnify:CR=1 FL=1
MSAKNARHKRKCREKLSYGSRAEALRKAIWAGHVYQWIYKVYQCQFCGKWHLSKQVRKHYVISGEMKRDG